MSSHYKDRVTRKRQRRKTSEDRIRAQGLEIHRNSRLEAIYIKNDGKTLSMQEILELSSARMENVSIGMLKTSRNGDKKFKQSTKITSRPST